MRQNGDKIIYSIDFKLPNNHILPRSLEYFYHALPDVFSYLYWISERVECGKNLQKKIEEFEKTGNSTEVMNEVTYLKKSARQNGMADDFHIGTALVFSEGNLYFQEFNFERMIYDLKIIPTDRIGLFVNWGGEYLFSSKYVKI
ncbi:MAG: hypothetical protein K0B07_02910 [DPANN group archaeon]|nr:hypothetical protein [DPANN group archaeon]